MSDIADEETAVAAGSRPCGACLRDRYAEWNALRDGRKTALYSPVALRPAGHRRAASRSGGW